MDITVYAVDPGSRSQFSTNVILRHCSLPLYTATYLSIAANQLLGGRLTIIIAINGKEPKNA